MGHCLGNSHQVHCMIPVPWCVKVTFESGFVIAQFDLIGLSKCLALMLDCALESLPTWLVKQVLFLAVDGTDKGGISSPTPLSRCEVIPCDLGGSC